jgi:excisionase family DNA binding protein
LADELLTIDEVAAKLKLHPDTIRRYIRDKKLKSVRIGGTAIRIWQSELDSFIVDSDQTDGKKDESNS